MSAESKIARLEAWNKELAAQCLSLRKTKDEFFRNGEAWEERAVKAEAALRIASNELSRLLFNEPSETTHKAIDAVDIALAVLTEENRTLRTKLAPEPHSYELELREERWTREYNRWST